MTEPNSKPTYRISDLHESDRPRERLESLGPQALTNAELIAILLRVGVPGENAVEVGQRLLNKFGGLKNWWTSMDWAKPRPRRSRPQSNSADG
jgi:DNA repair protein RadC